VRINGGVFPPDHESNPMSHQRAIRPRCHRESIIVGNVVVNEAYNHLRSGCCHAGRAFLEQLTRDKRGRQAHYDAFKAMSEFTFGGAHERAASKFALVAMAGELAIEYDIVPWLKGAAFMCLTYGLEEAAKHPVPASKYVKVARVHKRRAPDHRVVAAWSGFLQAQAQLTPLLLETNV
jgi:hypothetical protein